jgi:hypothetical protein
MISYLIQSRAYFYDTSVGFGVSEGGVTLKLCSEVKGLGLDGRVYGLDFGLPRGKVMTL